MIYCQNQQNLIEIKLIELILHGTGNSNVDNNLSGTVRKYIAKSKRFV